jgi:hypothetical protein
MLPSLSTAYGFKARQIIAKRNAMLKLLVKGTDTVTRTIHPSTQFGRSVSRLVRGAVGARAMLEEKGAVAGGTVSLFLLRLGASWNVRFVMGRLGTVSTSALSLKPLAVATLL